jgi:NitT/TauT family transport system ATP-binding protein
MRKKASTDTLQKATKKTTIEPAAETAAEQPAQPIEQAAEQTTEQTTEPPIELAQEVPLMGETESCADTEPDQTAAPGEKHIVELKGVGKWFTDARTGKHSEVLKDLDLTIEDETAGEFVVLLGPSGCGKSTILSLISGLTAPDSGEVHTFGRPVTGPNPCSATVPQAYTCFPWLTVLKNVEFGLGLKGEPRARRRQTALDYLRKVGLGDRSEAYPKQLSGGMQQRVAIARTLAMKRPIVLMDEPFGALDAQTRSEMQQMLLQLWEEEGNTIIFVTHDIAEALLLGDRVIVFSAGPARIIWEQRKLDAIFGHNRPPSLTRDPKFTELAEVLREHLKKPQPGKLPEQAESVAQT